MDAVAPGDTFPIQILKYTPLSDNLWPWASRKCAPWQTRCIVPKQTMEETSCPDFEILHICTHLRRETNFQVKLRILNHCHARDCWKWENKQNAHAVDKRSRLPNQKVKNNPDRVFESGKVEGTYKFCGGKFKPSCEIQIPFSVANPFHYANQIFLLRMFALLHTVTTTPPYTALPYATLHLTTHHTALHHTAPPWATLHYTTRHATTLPCL